MPPGDTFGRVSANLAIQALLATAISPAYSTATESLGGYDSSPAGVDVESLGSLATIFLLVSISVGAASSTGSPAAAFIVYLRSPAGQAILKHYGYLPPSAR